MATVSIAIMACPARRDHVEGYMVRRLREQGAEPFVSWDEDRNGPWWNWKRAWASRPAESTHHVVLQDDVTFCADLPDTLRAIASSGPGEENPVSLFLPRPSIAKAFERGVWWVRTSRFLWAQGLMMPVWFGDAGVDWIEKFVQGEGVHDDTRLAAWFKAAKRLPYVTAPTVINHIGDELEGGSLMKHNGPAEKRRSQIYVGDDVRAAGLPWNTTAFEKE